MGISTVQEIVKQVGVVVWETLCPEYMPTLQTPAEWRTVADGFDRWWQFPNCYGALDRKYCVIQAPPHSGSLYWNYKKTFSIILMALVDSKYRYIMIDIGAPGMEGDSNTFWNSAFGMEFMNNNIPFPQPENLPRNDIRVLFVLIRDEAFPSDIHLLKPYSKKSKCTTAKTRAVFNYRLSCMRMCVECVFGVLSSQFHFLLRHMVLSPDMASVLVKAACMLHNFLVKPNDPLVQAMEVKLNAELEQDRQDCHEWNYRKLSEDDVGLQPVAPLPGYHTSKEAHQSRNLFATYFQSKEGYIPWQDKYSCITDLLD